MRTLFGSVANGGTCLGHCLSHVTPGELTLPRGGRGSRE
jgi:hypothetical protein